MTPGTQSITEKFITNGFSNFYEGEYVITVSGFNSVYPSNTMENEFTWKLMADCSHGDTIISGPTTVWSNPTITSTDIHGPDFTREYQTAPGPSDPPMEIYYGVGTDATYSLNANNYNAGSWS